MSHTTEYSIKAVALVNGETITKTFGGFSSTEGFSQELLTDMATDEFESEFPEASIKLINAALQPVT